MLPCPSHKSISSFNTLSPASLPAPFLTHAYISRRHPPITLILSSAYGIHASFPSSPPSSIPTAACNPPSIMLGCSTYPPQLHPTSSGNPNSANTSPSPRYNSFIPLIPAPYFNPIPAHASYTLPPSTFPPLIRSFNSSRFTLPPPPPPSIHTPRPSQCTTSLPPSPPHSPSPPPPPVPSTSTSLLPTPPPTTLYISYSTSPSSFTLNPILTSFPPSPTTTGCAHTVCTISNTLPSSSLSPPSPHASSIAARAISKYTTPGNTFSPSPPSPSTSFPPLPPSTTRWSAR